MIGNIQQAIEYRHLEIGVKQGDQGVCVAHAVPERIEIGKMPHS